MIQNSLSIEKHFFKYNNTLLKCDNKVLNITAICLNTLIKYNILNKYDDKLIKYSNTFINYANK